MTKVKRYYIIHINYTINRAYLFYYDKTRIFTLNQAWSYIDYKNNSDFILSRISINGKDSKEIKEIFEKDIANVDNTKILFLRTLPGTDDNGNNVELEYPSEKKFEDDLNFLLDEDSTYDCQGNINVVDVNSFSEFEQEEIINDSEAIQQEQSDSEKELIKEDFVKFEEILKQNKFIDCYFEGKVKLTSEFVNECSHPSIIPLIYNFFPFAVVEHEEENCSIKVETRLGTIFILKPLDCPDIDCLEQYRKEHYYDVSLCIF